jgi:hypothetical protein
MKVNLTDLKTNPVNDEIYSHADSTDLMLSLKTHGQLEPIVINRDNIIISGHRRFYSMTQLGWNDCDVRIAGVENEIVALIEFNRTRVKTVADILNESRYLERELKIEVGRGRTATVQRNGERMKTIVEVSKKLGLSTTQLKKIKSISNYEPELIGRIDSGDISVNQAYLIVQEKYIRKDKPAPKPEFQSKFSKLLNDYSPSQSAIQEVLLTTYPYSVGDIENGEEKRDELVSHLDQLKQLDSRELTLYRKYQEVKRLNPKPSLVKRIEKNLWKPTDISNKKKTITEIERLEPVIEFVESGNLEEFNILRVKTSSMEWITGPGRSVKAIIRDKPTGKYLGVLTLASDFRVLEVRDAYIGWSNKKRSTSRNHLCNMNTCHAIQPLGFNFLGGKLVASLATTSVVRDKWFEKYDDRLIGISTSSLYGKYSMYDGIPYWRGLGESKGNQFIKPDEEHYRFWADWIRENHPEEYEDATNRSSPRQNIIRLIFKYLGISLNDYKTDHRRGIYFANLYENGREFLCDEIEESELVMNEKFVGDTKSVMDWWKPKAIKRYEKLLKDGKLQPDTLWYDDIDQNAMESWLSARGQSTELITDSEKNKEPLSLDEMYDFVGITKDKLWSVLRDMGTDFLTIKSIKDFWTPDLPTTGYCYVVAEFIYCYIAPKGTVALVVKVEEPVEIHHWFLKYPDGTIVDLTKDQFKEFPDYTKAKKRPFLGKSPSKRTRELAIRLGYEETTNV